MTDLASAAFRLALRGLAVFPLAEGTKIPVLGSSGVLDAVAHCDVARARWNKYPRGNIAVATGPKSNFWALDIDPRSGGNYSLAKLIRRNGKLPSTVAVRTPSGGVHMWWKWSGIDIRNSAGKVGRGIDVRGDGGYVIAPPSMLRNGRSYRWITEFDAAAVCEAPDWLIGLAGPAPRKAPAARAARRGSPLTPVAPVARSGADGPRDRYVAAAIRSELHALAQAREGTRNDQLNRSAFAIAGFVHAGFIPADWAIGKLESCAREIGLEPTEIRRTIESAFRKAPARELI